VNPSDHSTTIAINTTATNAPILCTPLAPAASLVDVDDGTLPESVPAAAAATRVPVWVATTVSRPDPPAAVVVTVTVLVDQPVVSPSVTVTVYQP
jgi:hypothetical protein